MNQPRWRSAWLAVPLLAALVAAGCDRPNPLYYCQENRCTALSKAASLGEFGPGQEREFASVFEIPGKIAAWHGRTCGGARPPDLSHLQESIDVPTFVTQAAVILNGWRFTLLDGADVRPAGLGTLIANVKLAGQKLSWDAYGAIGDEYFDDKYTWCYSYTAVGWNDSAIQAQSHELPTPCADTHNPRCGLVVYPTSLEHPPFAGGQPVAALPHGFAFVRDRAEVLQIAYNLDHSELLGWPQLTSPLETVFDAGRVSWESKAIFQDEDPNRVTKLCMADLVSLVGGSGVGIVQPPFSITPVQGGGSGGCITSGAGVEEKQDFSVSGLPFDVAIPMLTGWSLEYDCGDDYVAEAGVWLEKDFSYDKTGPAPGTLRGQVSSILRNKDNAQGFSPRTRISVLGFKLVLGPPDLVAVEQDANFCTRDAQGQLRIRVQNRGESPVSSGTTTRVSFQVMNNVVTQDLPTPPIQPGQGVDLPPVPMPNRCFSPVCAFRIEADFNGGVAESPLGESNNLVMGACPR